MMRAGAAPTEPALYRLSTAGLDILEIDDVREKLLKLTTIITKELEVLELGRKIQTEAQSEMEKMQREYFLREQLKAFLAQFWEASAALRSGNLKAAEGFPDGCYPPALPFVGSPSPPRPPSPPTRLITVLESGEVERGEIPVVEIAVRLWPAAAASTGTWSGQRMARPTS